MRRRMMDGRGGVAEERTADDLQTKLRRSYQITRFTKALGRVPIGPAHFLQYVSLQERNFC